MKSFSIRLSRRGYAYQDKYALLKFLESLCNGDLKEFYVDYPFGNKGNSLDILMITQIEEHAYEVKTGEEFKRDKHKELGRALRALYSYQKNRERCKIYLVISPELHSGVLNNWSDLQFIRDKGRNARNTRGQTMLEVAKSCHDLFGFKALDVNLDDFISFVKTLKLEQGPSCEKDGEIDSHPDLEDLIVSKIKDLGEKLDLVSSEFEIPNWSIALELLEIIRQGAEGRLAIIRSAIETLINLFGRRSLIANRISYDSGVTPDKMLKYEKEKISKKLSEILKMPYKTISPISTIVEGKPVE